MSSQRAGVWLPIAFVVIFLAHECDAGKYGFQLYDALIAAAALETDCTTLYSEDFQDGQVIESRLTVRNPFSPTLDQRRRRRA